MKISVITPVFNGEETISTCIESVIDQSYSSKEHIIIDGKSADQTISVIKKYQVKYISEKDNGIYDAINKGINMATGDIICILGSDDFYAHKDIFQRVADTFKANPDADIVFGDMIFVDRIDSSKINRYWKSSPFKPGLFKSGWLPQNHTLFIRRSIYSKYGCFNQKFLIADYELQYRFFEKHRIKSIYKTGVMVKMRSGGVSNSSIKNIYQNMNGCYEVLKYYKVKHPFIYIVNTLIYRFKQIFIPSSIKKMYG